MRKILIAGNWKMNTTKVEAIELSKQLTTKLDPSSPIEMTVIPPYTHLDAVLTEIKNSPISLGAQNVHAKEKVPIQVIYLFLCLKITIVNML